MLCSGKLNKGEKTRTRYSLEREAAEIRGHDFCKGKHAVPFHPSQINYACLFFSRAKNMVCPEGIRARYIAGTYQIGCGEAVSSMGKVFPIKKGLHVPEHGYVSPQRRLGVEERKCSIVFSEEGKRAERHCTFAILQSALFVLHNTITFHR